MLKSFLSTGVVFAVLPNLFTSNFAMASSTYSYNCQAAVHDPIDGTVWFYEMSGNATFGIDSFVSFQNSPKLSVRRSVSSDPQNDETVVYVSGANLRQDGFDHGPNNHSFFLMSLPSSVYGLRIYLDTVTNEIYVNHKVSPDKTIESSKPTACQLVEIG